MIPILFPALQSDFSTNGIGHMADAVNCICRQVLNGEYELTLKYPVTGIRYADIQLRNIVLAKPDPISDAQPFRIYRISKPINGIVTAYARHIAYDLAGVTVSPFTASSLANALSGFSVYAVTNQPFTFWTDKSVQSPFTAAVPASVWQLLGGQAGSILDAYGGEYEFDRWTVKLWNNRGQDRGVSIRYGKNLTTFEQDANNSNVITGIYPFWTDGQTMITLPERVINSTGTYDFERVIPLDMTQYFEVAPTVEQLRARAQSYMADNNVGTPQISWKITHVMLEQSEEYKGSALFERVYLGDTVRVVFPAYGVDASAKAVEISYNVLLDRYESITLGSVKSSLAKTIATQTREIEAKPTQTMVESISGALTSKLLGISGGSIRLLDTNADGSPDELYIADNADPALAVKVWRFNYNGWASSASGYNGPFVMGATLEEGLLARAVTAARLVAGTIQSADGSTFFLDLDNGILNMDVSQLKLNGENMSVIIEGLEQNTTDSIAAVQNDLDDLRAHILIGSDGSMTFIGADGNPITLRIVNDSLGIFDSSTSVATFGVGGATMPNVTIPEGGSLTMGHFKWAPRSSGNLSLLYVG